jgi:hypothetical protein
MAKAMRATIGLASEFLSGEVDRVTFLQIKHCCPEIESMHIRARE